MLVRAGIAFSVVASGIALGAVLGAAANPVMKMPAEKPWQNAFQAPVVADAGYHLMIEAPPQDLSPYRDSYAPTWAREELADWEPEYPAWTYSELTDEPLADRSAAEETAIDAQQVANAAEAAGSPQVAPEPIAAADLASPPPPADPAPSPRLVAHLDGLY